MKKPITCLIILSCFFLFPKLHANPVLSFFMRPYHSKPKSQEKIEEKIQRVGHINSSLLKEYYSNSLAGVPGIFCSYAGFLQVSDIDGQVTFPLQQQSPELYFAVTAKITPIIRSGNTISHLEFEEGTPAKLYRVLQQNDERTKRSFWNIEEVPLPQDRIIPIESIIIFANPKYVVVPQGITLIQESANWILPNVYIKRGIALGRNALYVLNLSHYFGQLLHLYKKEKKGYISHLIS